MNKPLTFLGRIAALGGVLGCLYFFLALFSGRSGCRLPNIFAPGCSSAWTGVAPLVVGALLGTAFFVWTFRGSDRNKAVAGVVGIVYAIAVFVLFWGYVSLMAGGMH